MRLAPTVEINREQRETLRQLVDGHSVRRRVADRCRIILLAADRKQDTEIARELGISIQKVARWRRRFLQAGIEALLRDAPGRGRPPSISISDVRSVIEMTTSARRPEGGLWSTRSLASHVGINESTLRRLWRAHGLSSPDIHNPRIAGKLSAIDGIFMGGSDLGLVVRIDDSMRRDLELHCNRNAALPIPSIELSNVAITSTLIPIKRVRAWINFLRLVDSATPKGEQLLLICTNYDINSQLATHRWLMEHDNFHVRFSSTERSWWRMFNRFSNSGVWDLHTSGVRRDFENIHDVLQALPPDFNLVRHSFFWTLGACKIANI